MDPCEQYLVTADLWLAHSLLCEYESSLQQCIRIEDGRKGDRQQGWSRRDLLILLREVPVAFAYR